MSTTPPERPDGSIPEHGSRRSARLPIPGNAEFALYAVDRDRR